MARSVFGKLMRHFRENGPDGLISRENLASMMREIGVLHISGSAIAKYETGAREVPPDFVFAVQIALDLNFEEVTALLAAVTEDFEERFTGAYSLVAEAYMQRLRERIEKGA